MKSKFNYKLIFTICVTFLSLNSNAFTKSQKSLNGLSMVYGYVVGQEATLIRILNQFPELKSDVDLVKAEIETVYPNIKLKTSNKIIELIGPDSDQLFASIDKKIRDANTGEITRPDAIRFLSTVRSRSAGNIENKEAKMFMLAINNFENPINELSLNNNIVTFNTKSEEKAKGIELSIKLPQSWEERQGNSPNTIRTWNSEAGSGTSSITLLVTNSDNVLTKNNLKSRINSKKLQGLVPQNSKISNVFQTDISGQPGWMYTAELTTKRLDSEIFMNFKSLNIYYKSNLIQLNCASAGLASDVELVKKEFGRISKICDYIHNSLIIDSVYR